MHRTQAIPTAIILCGLAATWAALPDGSAVSIFAAAAIGVGLSLTFSTAVEATGGIRSIIRTDILMLWVLYGLTFLEYLFPQADDNVVLPATATNGTLAALCGFAGLAVGRHLVPWRTKSKFASFPEVQPRSIFVLFVIATALGYLHIAIAVQFDPLEMLRQMLLPRFEQSWGRGRYGTEAYAILVEIGALIYLIPPLAGLILARSPDFSTMKKLVVAITTSLTFFYGLTGGTRSVLAVYVITFFAAYVLNGPKIKLWRLGLQGAIIVFFLLVASSWMLEFRNVGIEKASLTERSRDTVYIDHNMAVISELTNAFPGVYDYLGFEIPYIALIHPIPRILWPGKPEGLSVSVESVMGTSQATIASTFIGEGYMSGGMWGVLLAGVLFGAGAEMWNRVGRDVRSPFAQLLYASGFFCAVIGMRSLLWISVTLLPTLALWLYGKLWLSGSSGRRAA
jgi:oligosaccharide repeat unit polymerase